MTEHPIHRFASLPSTMDKAAELAEADCPSGTVVIADEQTSGQGRHGRAWHSEADSGLYMSEVLRLKICPDSLPVVTLASGIATAEAISTVSGVACDLRWPNDVLAGGKKCAGILAQLYGNTLVLGIGINVNHAHFPEDLSGIATSLRIESGGRRFSRDELLATLIGSLDRTLEILLRDGKEPILRAFTQVSSYAQGRRVVVDQGAEHIEGVTEGLDPQGFLYVRQDNGKRTTILAGGVRLPCS